jgi:hypothetical protein
VPKICDYHFYDDFKATFNLAEEIRVKIETDITVSQTDVETLKKLVSTAKFRDWGHNEYRKFLKAFEYHDLDDVRGIATFIESKSLQQV